MAGMENRLTLLAFRYASGRAIWGDQNKEGKYREHLQDQEEQA
jgi:hypothetical protein